MLSGSKIKSFGMLCLCLLMSRQLGCWQRCWLNKSTLPPLLGFRLGMSREELETKLPGLKGKDAPYTELFLSGSKTVPNGGDVSPVDEIGHVTVSTLRFPEFAEISTLELKLEDGRVAAIELIYQDSSKWKNEDEFVAFVAQTLNLPDLQHWDTKLSNKSGGTGTSVTCNGLTVRAGFHLIVGAGLGGPAAIAFP